MAEETMTTSPAGPRACTNHPGREAVARCPECARFFCRECITEHDFRMICASCLAKVRDGAGPAGAGRRGAIRVPLMPLVHGGAAIVFLWFLFYTLAQTLLEIPADVHEGTAFGETIEAIFVED